MGTFVFNAHVLTADRDAVATALSTVKGGVPAYVSEPRDGWVSVYAKDADAHVVARKVSDLLGLLTVSFEVYDSDEVRCAVYREGKRLARRHTGPEVQEPEPGDPNKFAKAAGGASVADFARVLGERPVFAEETAFALAALFGIPRERVDFSYRWVTKAEPAPAWVAHAAKPHRAINRPNSR